MRHLPLTAVLATSLLSATAVGCGGGGTHTAPHRVHHAARDHSVAAAQPAARRSTTTPRHVRTVHPRALVAAESENHLLVVSLPSGRVLQRLRVPAGPQYVVAQPGTALVTSPAAGVVTVLRGERRISTGSTLHGFSAPHIIAISPDAEYAFVTDDARGTLSVIELVTGRVITTIHVGAGAHHIGASPNQRRLWIALGESARKFVIVDTSNIGHPRVIGSFDPGFPAHDLAFSPDGRSVWITSAVGPDVTVFSATSHRVLFRVPVGPPPQHVVFHGDAAYLTSGYGSVIERVAASNGKVLQRAHTPYGSFELDVQAGFVATASLLNGSLAVFTPTLRPLGVHKLAAATRDVAIAEP